MKQEHTKPEQPSNTPELGLHSVRRCSLINDCGNQQWRCINVTALTEKYKCFNCGGTKSVFRNLYPGYQ